MQSPSPPQRAKLLTCVFCPLCRAEYREGFYRCADCDVDLVSFLPDSAQQKPAGEKAEAESWALLSRENDPVFLTALVSALDEAHIPHQDIPIQDFEASLSHSFPLRQTVGRG